MRSRGFRSKVVWLLDPELRALEEFCRDHRYSPPPGFGTTRKGMTYQGMMRAVLVSFLKAKGYLPRNYVPPAQSGGRRKDEPWP